MHQAVATSRGAECLGACGVGVSGMRAARGENPGFPGPQIQPLILLVVFLQSGPLGVGTGRSLGDQFIPLSVRERTHEFVRMARQN
jgi:hypothetical protein